MTSMPYLVAIKLAMTCLSVLTVWFMTKQSWFYSTTGKFPLDLMKKVNCDSQMITEGKVGSECPAAMCLSDVTNTRWQKVTVPFKGITIQLYILSGQVKMLHSNY